MRKTVTRALPEHFQWASSLDLPALRERAKPQAAVEKVREALQGDARTFVLIGPAGAGKTSLGAALHVAGAAKLVEPARRSDAPGTRWLGETPPSPALFVTTFDLAKARREHRLGDGEAKVIAEATKATILLLDEVGAEVGRGDTAVSEIIHSRHAHDRRTIYTTPFVAEELASRYGDGICRRLFEGAVVVKLGRTAK